MHLDSDLPVGCIWGDADAAIVNYYGKADTLGGHKDDVESDLTQPLISISLGCDAIFLLGGQGLDWLHAAHDRHMPLSIKHGQHLLA